MCVHLYFPHNTQVKCSGFFPLVNILTSQYMIPYDSITIIFHDCELIKSISSCGPITTCQDTSTNKS